MFLKPPTLLDGEMVSSATPGGSEPGEVSTKDTVTKTVTEPVKNLKTFKINGKLVEVDLSNQAHVDKLLQLGLASGDKFQEASRMRKEAEDILSAAKTEKSAAKALKKAGFSDSEIKEILEKELANYYEEEALSPEEKQRREREERLAEYERREKEREENELKTKQEREIAKEVEMLETELLSALEKSSLPRTPILAKWATQYLAAFDAKGVTLSAEDAVRMVENEFPTLVANVLSSTKDVQQLKALLGKETVKKLLDDSVAAVKTAEKPFTKDKQLSRETSSSDNSKPKQKESMNNYFERLRRGNL